MRMISSVPPWANLQGASSWKTEFSHKCQTDSRMKSDPSRSSKVLGFLAKYCTTRSRTRLTDFNKLSIFMLLFEFFPIPDFDCWFRRDGSMDLKILLLEKGSKSVFQNFGVFSRKSSTVACPPQTDSAVIPGIGNFPAISYQQRWADIKKEVRGGALSFVPTTLVSEAKNKNWCPPMRWVLVQGILPLLWVWQGCAHLQLRRSTTVLRSYMYVREDSPQF